MSERLAENAHDMWAKKKKEELEALGTPVFSFILHQILPYM